MFGWMTDIHMNFLQNAGVKRKFLKSITNFKGPIFITGDISDGSALEKHLVELSNATEYPIYFVTGNHDYYHSSFKNIREMLERLIKEQINLIYLPVFGMTPLSEDTCIIGTDSWCDGRISRDLISLPFAMNDFNYIQDLCTARNKNEIMLSFQKRADDALKHLKDLCEQSVKRYKKIIILSHQVPLEQLLGPEINDISPFYIWYDAGKFILDFSQQHRDIKFLWLCGHTHSHAKFEVDNFYSHCLGAEYYYPEIGAIVNLDLSVKLRGKQ